MTWTNLRDNFNKVRDKANYYLSPYARATGARLTQVANAVYHYEAVTHFRQGFTQIFKVPEFMRAGKQTKELLERSIKDNLLYYLLPIALYRSFFSALQLTNLYKINPEYMGYAISSLDIVITMSYILTRIYPRHIKNNLLYNTAYVRTIENDINNHLPTFLANELTQELGEMFDKIFLHANRTHGSYDPYLSSNFQAIFADFFKKHHLEPEKFNTMILPLSKIIENSINQQELIRAANIVHDFSFFLAREIVTEFAKEFQTTQTPEKTYTKDELLNTLTRYFDSQAASKFADELRKRIASVKFKAQSFLPVEHHPACNCKDTDKISIPVVGIDINTPSYYLRIISAGISAPFYYLGNIAFLYLPHFFKWRGSITPEEFFYAKVLTFFLRILIAGQAQNECYIAKYPHCKYHRDRILAGNKAHSMGVGAAEILGAELLAFIVYLTFGVDSFFTRDPINQLMAQINLIATLAFNDPLPGKKRNAWNWFYLPKEGTRKLISFIGWLFMPDPREPKERDRLLTQLTEVFTSPWLHKSVRLILGPGAIYPSKPLLIKDKTNGAMIAKPDDALDILFHDEEVRYVLGLYRQDINNTISTANTIQYMFSWFFVGLPISMTSPLVMTLSKLLDNLVKNIQLKLVELDNESAEKKVVVLEEKTITAKENQKNIDKDKDKDKDKEKLKEQKIEFEDDAQQARFLPPEMAKTAGITEAPEFPAMIKVTEPLSEPIVHLEAPAQPEEALPNPRLNAVKTDENYFPNLEPIKKTVKNVMSNFPKKEEPSMIQGMLNFGMWGAQEFGKTTGLINTRPQRKRSVSPPGVELRSFR